MRGENELGYAFSGGCGLSALNSPPAAADYMSDVTGEGYDSLSAEEKVELLEALLTIMKSFVNLGHGLDPVNKLIEEFESVGTDIIDVIDYEDASDDE